MPGTVTDKTDNGNDGTPSGDVGFDTEYKAFTFDGVDDEINSTLSVSGEYIHSISLWVKADEVSRTAGAGVYTFFTIGSASSVNMIALGVNTDSSEGIKYDFFNASVSATSNEVVPHRWMHFVVTYAGGANNAFGAKRIYLNGKELSVIGTGGSSSSSALNLPSNPTLKLGGEINASNPRFSGSIANFRLFNRALAGDEVWQLYAYQKEYFGHGNLGMALKAGRLGIGTTEPMAVLDVRGNFYSQNMICQTQQYEYYPDNTVTVTSGSTTVLTCPFTPKYSNSKILIELSCPVQASATYFNIFVNRGSSRITSNPDNYGIVSYNSGTNLSGHFIHTGIGYDLPATTSTINYNVVAEHGSGASLLLLLNSGKLLVFIHELCQ